ncbi:MAG: hypothetical protein AABX33_01300 [Nanoarchaeota archaeon]
MQINVVSRQEEPLLSRTSVKAMLDFEKATPSYAEVTALLASTLKVDGKLIAIRHIYNLFGAKRAEVTAYIYGNEDKKRDIEPKIKEKKEKKASK